MRKWTFTDIVLKQPMIVRIVESKTSIKIFLILLVGLIVSSCQSETVSNDKDAELPSLWMAAQRAYPYDRIDYKAIDKAQEQVTEMMASRDPLYDRNWDFEGPTNIGGRITDIEMPRNDKNTIYAGSASGGIFRSKDRGLNWESIFDGQLSLAIGDIDIYREDPSIIYVGTGEANGGGGSLAYDGRGVYKSFNGGDSWQPLGLENVGSIGKVLVHPCDPDLVYVAAMGRLFESDSNRGVYKTMDGGASWEQVLFINDSVGAIDIVIHPERPDRIYAAMWQRSRNPRNIDYGGEGSDIYRSEDGGDNWVIAGQGLPTLADEKGRIALATAESDETRLYAFYSKRNGSIQGYYESFDGGFSWDELSVDGVIDVPFMWWFGKLTVDPTDPETVYLPGLEVYRKTDFIGTWSQIFQGVHVDQHSLFIHPEDPELIVIGNDGGVYVSTDKGRNFIKSPDLPNIQFYTSEIDESNPQQLYGGAQDNGSVRTQTGAIDDWEVLTGGDGMSVLVDPLSSDIIYAMTQNGGIQRSFDGGENFISARNGLSGLFNWNAPLEMDPSNSARLYIGGDRLYTSMFGEEWTAISENMSNGPYLGNRGFGTITAISVSPLDPNIIYTGTDDGNIWVTLDQGSTWDELSGSLPNRWVSSIEADPQNRNNVYVSYSGYRFGEDIGHIYSSVNFGESWTDISANLPDIPLNDIIVHPSRSDLYVASDIAVFYRNTTGSNWSVLGQGLPRVPVTSLDYHESLDFLLAGTYGRSMYTYEFDLSTAVLDESSSKNASNLRLSPNPVETGGSIFLSSDKKLGAVQIYSMQGELLYSESTNSKKLEFQVPLSFTTGHYIVISESGRSTLVVQ